MDAMAAIPQSGASSLRQVLGACPHDCPDTCALVTTVQDGVALRIQGNPLHGPTAGVLCNKVAHYVERTYHASRLLQPMRRVGPKGSGRFEAVTWPEALDDIAARLGAIAARDPQAILPYSYCGTMGLVQGEGMAARRRAMSSSASSQPTVSKRPEPLGPTRRSGRNSRPLWYVRST